MFVRFFIDLALKFKEKKNAILVSRLSIKQSFQEIELFDWFKQHFRVCMYVYESLWLLR